MRRTRHRLHPQRCRLRAEPRPPVRLRRRARRSTPPARAGFPRRPSRSARARASGRATTTASVPAGNRADSTANASRSSRLTRLRSTAPPTLRETDSPSRGGPRPRHAGTRTARAPGPRASGRCRKTRSKSALRDEPAAPRDAAADCGRRAASDRQVACGPCRGAASASGAPRACASARGNRASALACAFSADRCVSWLTSPGRVGKPVYAAADAAAMKTAVAARPASAFSRALRQRRSQRRFGPRWPLIYSRLGARARTLTNRSPSNAPGRSRLELPAHLEPTSAWREIRAELRRIGRRVDLRHLARPARGQGVGRGGAPAPGAARQPRRGSPSASAASSRRCARTVIGGGQRPRRRSPARSTGPTGAPASPRGSGHDASRPA